MNNVILRKLRHLARYQRRSLCSMKDTPLKRLLDEAASYNDKEVVDPELEWATLPYAQIPNNSYKVRVDPKETSVILFPGQGAQFVGMGKELMKFPQARELYEMASDILKQDMKKICFEGPVQDLNKNCQLAIMVTSLATLEKLKEERPSSIEQCAATAGFSLGEITALVFAGALDFDQALKLVQIRATAMEAASQDHPSGMLTVMYGPDSKVNYAVAQAKEHCIKKGIDDVHCQIANYLFPHCKVIAGSKPALEYIEQHAKQFGLRRTQRIKVSGAFHTEVMRPAVAPFRMALEACEVKMPAIPVISNVDARPYRDAKQIRHQLPKQIVRPVRWEQSLHAMFSRKTDEGFPQVFTVGPGSNLRSILRQVNAKAWDNSLHIEC